MFDESPCEGLMTARVFWRTIVWYAISGETLSVNAIVGCPPLTGVLVQALYAFVAEVRNYAKTANAYFRACRRRRATTSPERPTKASESVAGSGTVFNF